MDEIKKEMDWYPYIERFLTLKRITAVQNEVEFFEQLKVPDLFGYDKNYYYISEVKKDNIAKDDYYNLKYIIENNILDKPIRGLLFGQCKDSKLYNIIMNDSSIELISFKEAPYGREYVSIGIQNKFEYYRKQCKFYRKVLDCISDSNLKHIEIGGNYIKVIYNISYGKEMIFKSYNTNAKSRCNHLCGYLYTKSKDESIDEIVVSKPEEVGVKLIRNKVYKLKLLYISDNSRNNINKLHVSEIYESLYILLRYMDIDTLGWNLEDNKFIIDRYNKEVGIEFIKLSDYCEGAIWCNIKYSEIFFTYNNKKENEFNFKNSNIIPHYKEYNNINYIEAINIIIKDKLYEPIKRIYFSGYESVITLSIEFIFNNEIKALTEKYTVLTFYSITDVNFYLICNMDIILDFENKVIEKIEKNKWDIIYNEERNYSYNYLRKKILKNMKLVKTIRQCINELENN